MNFNNNPELNRLAEFIYKTKKRQLKTLFIIGSGVSHNPPASVPLLPDMISQLENICQSKKFLHSSLLPYFKDPDNQEKVSHLFNELQRTDDEEILEVWEKFNSWLIDDIGILNLDPCKAHKKIAELYKLANVFCASLNFDGLTKVALERQGDFNAVYALDTPIALESFFCAPRDNIAGVVKLRGDAIYARCRTPNCPSEGNKEQIWRLRGQFGSEALRCDQCKKKRSLYLLFPGELEKEEENRPLLAMLWRYLMPSVRVVVTCGLSGKWDDDVVAFLNEVKKEGIMIFEINDSSSGESRIFKEVLRGNAEYRVLMPVDDALEALVNLIRAQPESESQTINFEVHQWEIDRIWHKKISLSPFENEVKNSEDIRYMSQNSQLGRKCKWLGIEDQSHSRLEHSRGVMLIATDYYKKLRSDKGTDQELQLLRLAALLHDIGHVPFSHLMEEVFHELGWTIAGEYELFGHNYYTEQKIQKIFKKKEMQSAISPYTVSDLIALVNGKLGIPFLDAIINSAIDADKIDYIFRDALTTSTPIGITPESFLNNFFSGIFLSSNLLLCITNNAFLAFQEFLRTRENLYQSLYLNEIMRFGESAVRFLLRCFILHKLDFLNSNLLLPPNIDTLDPVKIEFTLHMLRENFKDNEDSILEGAKEFLDRTKAIDTRIKKAIDEAYYIINLGREEIRSEYKKRRMLGPSRYPRGLLDTLQYARTQALISHPGSLLIDIAQLPDYLAVSKLRKPKKRLDSTKEPSEVILLNEGQTDKNYPYTKRLIPLLNSSFAKIDEEDHPIILNVYRLSPNGEEARAARDIFIKTLREKGVKV